MALTRSAEWLQRSQKVMAGGVSSDVRRSELPHPLFFKLGKGSRLYDIDGNEYIDYVLGQGPLLLGHSPRPVLDAVHKQLEQGLVYAAQHEAETELAELPALIGGLGPVVQVSLTETRILRDYRDWIRRDTATYQRLVAQLVPLGVRTITRGTWYLSTAHTEEDVQSTVEKVDSALKQGG